MLVPLGGLKVLEALCCDYTFWNISRVILHPLVTASLNPARVPQYNLQKVFHLVDNDNIKFSKMLY